MSKTPSPFASAASKISLTCCSEMSAASTADANSLTSMPPEPSLSTFANAFISSPNVFLALSAHMPFVRAANGSAMRHNIAWSSSPLACG